MGSMMSHMRTGKAWVREVEEIEAFSQKVMGIRSKSRKSQGNKGEERKKRTLLDETRSPPAAFSPRRRSWAFRSSGWIAVHSPI